MLASLGLTPEAHEDSRQRGSALSSTASTAVESSSLTGGKAPESAGSGVVPGEKSKFFKAYEKGAEYFTNLFPVWLTIFSLLALKDPGMFEWFTTE